MVSSTRRYFFFLFSVYTVYYLFIVVHRPRIYFDANEVNKKIIKKCKSMHRYYWPLFLFHNAYFQLIIGFIIGKIYPIIFKPKYKREIFTLSDGQKIGLDWIYPKNMNSIKDNMPICVALYGVAGDNRSFTIYKYCSYITSKLNYYSVVLGRRGHEVDIPLTIPKMTIFGGQNDIHSVLLYLNDKYPNNPLILIGDSAGTGFWVRYMGDLGLCINNKYKEIHNKSSSKLIIKHYKNATKIHDQILCSILICPGYDTATALFNINWFFRKVLLFLMKKTFISNHYNILINNNKEIVNRCNTSNSCIEFFREFSGSSLSGYESYNHFLIETNPIETVKYIQIPLLTINARDDPICTNICLDEWKWIFSDQQFCKNGILLETKYGSHSIFLSMFGGFYLDDIILQYLQTMYQTYINQSFQT
eukprot:332688_1